ncbi:hypothetical protein ABPG75_012743 [Micractinium tetrahymenae]
MQHTAGWHWHDGYSYQAGLQKGRGLCTTVCTRRIAERGKSEPKAGAHLGRQGAQAHRADIERVEGAQGQQALKARGDWVVARHIQVLQAWQRCDGCGQLCKPAVFKLQPGQPWRAVEQGKVMQAWVAAHREVAQGLQHWQHRGQLRQAAAVQAQRGEGRQHRQGLKICQRGAQRAVQSHQPGQAGEPVGEALHAGAAHFQAAQGAEAADSIR